MPPGTYSYQLADPAWRWLAETHPARPAGNQTFNDPVDHWGLETTAVIRDADPLNARRWHESYNNLPANSRQLLCGLGGPSQSYWDSTAHEWLHIAGTTGSADTTHGLMRYRAETDTFSKYSGRGYLPEGGLDRTYCLWPGRGGAHNFSGCSFDPVRRRLYRVLGQHNVGIGSPVQVCYADLAGMNTDPNNRGWLGTLGPEIPSNLSWPQSRFAPDRGPMGQIFCLFTSSGMTTPKVFDVATQSWSSVGWSSTFPSPPAGNDPVNDTTPFVPRFPATIYYEGYDYIATLVDGENQTWRVPLPANPSATDGSDIPPPEKNLAPCPVAMDASGYATGTHTNLTAMNGKIYAFHNDQEWDLENPVRDGGVFAYTVPTAPGDPGSWARVGDIWDESLRALLETQGTSLLDPAPMDRASYQCTAAAIPELGVVLIIWQPYSVHAVGFLWKPPVGG
ncbi:MAG: hypothetical protein MUD05_04745 [Candidatus Nanopelagicales bacterium]|nr:hypothetical protein [Candidatus Nanopelagicales bacterium]